MVEMHLLSVNADFRYDPIYALGVTTAFDRFMQGYQPEHDRVSIFAALCESVQNEPQQYFQSSDQIKSEAGHLAVATLLDQVQSDGESGALVSTLRSVAGNPNFKYSRLFAIGLFSVLEIMDADLVKDEKRLNETLEQISDRLHLSKDKMQKDLELYRSNLDKMTQAQIVMKDLLAAERKKKEQRAQDAKNRAIAASNGESAEDAS